MYTKINIHNMIPLEGRGHTRGSPISLLLLHKMNNKACTILHGTSKDKPPS